jgi:hypothetical protein
MDKNDLNKFLLRLLANAHGYFGLCFIYIISMGLRDIEFNEVGVLINRIYMFYLIPIFIGIPLILFLFIKIQKPYKPSVITYIILVLTILIFELFLII